MGGRAKWSYLQMLKQMLYHKQMHAATKSLVNYTVCLEGMDFGSVLKRKNTCGLGDIIPILISGINKNQN